MKYFFAAAVNLLTMVSISFSQNTNGRAMIVHVNGEVQNLTSGNQILKIGSILSLSDSIRLGKNASVTLLEWDGQLHLYTGSFRLRADSMRNEVIQKLIDQNLQSQNWLETVKKGTQNNFRSGSGNQLNMIYPRNTRLRKAPSQLKWTDVDKPDTEFEVSLRCYENDIAFDERTKSYSLNLSPDISIEAARQYFWFVRDVYSELSEVPSAVGFYVLSSKELDKLEKETKTIESIMNYDTLSVAYQLLYANLLISYELYDECKSLLDKLVKQDNHNKLVYTFYAIVYDKMDMIMDSRKYIEYADKYGN